MSLLPLSPSRVEDPRSPSMKTIEVSQLYTEDDSPTEAIKLVSDYMPEEQDGKKKKIVYLRNERCDAAYYNSEHIGICFLLRSLLCICCWRSRCACPRR